MLILRPMYQISHQVAVMDAAVYVRRYRDVPRFLGYCQQCENYGRVWSCPPFDFDVETLTDGYCQVAVWGTTITFDQVARETCVTLELSRQTASEAIEAAWQVLLPFLYRLEAEHSGARIFTGRCRQCRPVLCSRVEGRPCRKPQLMRHSLEAVGFDLSATVRDLLGIDLEWSRDGQLPSRITLVTALFSVKPLANLPLPE